jgi:hypothetical protein
LFINLNSFGQLIPNFSYASEATNKDSMDVNVLFSDKIVEAKIGDLKKENATIASHYILENYLDKLIDSRDDGDIRFIRAKENGDVYYLHVNSEIRVVIDRQNGEMEEFMIASDYYPIGSMDVDSKGNIYVSNPNNNRINVFSSKGDSIRSFGQLDYPLNISFGGGDTLFVSNRNSVHALDTLGNHLFSFGENSDIKGMSIVKNNFYFLKSRSIEEYDVNGEFVKTIPLLVEEGISTRTFYATGDLFYVALGNNGGTIYKDLVLDHSGTILKEIYDTKYLTQIEINQFRREAYFRTTSKIITYELKNNFRLIMKPIEEGEIKLFIPDSAVHFVNDQYNVKSDTLQLRFDWTPPSLTLSVSNSHLLAQLSEPITSDKIWINPEGFETKNGYLSKSNNLDYNAYLRSNSMIDSGLLVVKFPEKYFDLAGNPNTVNSIGIPHNIDPLNLVISSENQISSEKEVIADISFNKEVNDFTKEDVLFKNADLLSFSGSGRNYSASFKASFDETLIDIHVPMGVVHDSWGQDNTSAEFSFIIETSSPSVEIIVPENTNNSIVNARILFDDPVIHFDVDPIYCFVFPAFCFEPKDIIVNGGYIKSFTAESDYIFSLEVVAVSKLLQLSVPDSAAYNISNLPNIGSKVYQIGFENGVVLGKETEIEVDWYVQNKVLIINLNDPQFSEGRIGFFDLKGSLILSEDLKTKESETEINSMKEGVYILVIQWDNNFLKTKIKID